MVYEAGFAGLRLCLLIAIPTAVAASSGRRVLSRARFCRGAAKPCPRATPRPGPGLECHTSVLVVRCRRGRRLVVGAGRGRWPGGVIRGESGPVWPGLWLVAGCGSALSYGPVVVVEGRESLGRRGGGHRRGRAGLGGQEVRGPVCPGGGRLASGGRGCCGGSASRRGRGFRCRCAVVGRRG